MLFLQLPPVIFFFLLRLRCLTGHVREEEAGFEQENKMQLNSRIKYLKKKEQNQLRDPLPLQVGPGGGVYSTRWKLRVVLESLSLFFSFAIVD
jgi:hypothetical protein